MTVDIPTRPGCCGPFRATTNSATDETRSLRAPPRQLCRRPHPRCPRLPSTRRLRRLDRASRPNQPIRRRLYSIAGQPPSLLGLAPGCPFAPRCTHRMERCWNERPPLFTVSATHASACWLEAVAEVGSTVKVFASPGPDSAASPDAGIRGAEVTELGDSRAPERAPSDARAGSSTDGLAVMEHVVKHFPVQGPRRIGAEREVVHAVDDVSLSVRRGETLGRRR